MIRVEESAWYQQILNEGREVGIKEVIERRREEVRQVVMRILLRVLTHEFGEVPEKMKQQINLLSTQQLESLTDVALSANGLDEVQQHPLLADS